MKAYFQSDNFTFYNGNCIKILQEFPETSIDMIFVALPYFLSKGSFTCYAGKRSSMKKGELLGKIKIDSFLYS